MLRTKIGFEGVADGGGVLRKCDASTNMIKLNIEKWCAVEKVR